MTIDVELARTERRTVTLQVRDAFGREAIRRFKLERPAEDQSGQDHTRLSDLTDAVRPPAGSHGDSNAPSRAIQPGQNP
jgi:hypothetical protein